MQVAGPVLLHDEAVAFLLFDFGGRFGRVLKPPFPLIFFQ
jgi:hypothetical protein